MMRTVKARLVSHTKDYIENIRGGISKCYEAEVGAGAIKHCIEAGHLSVLEHSYATLDLEHSLAVLGQIVRHRHHSFTVKSTRGADFQPDYYIPVTIQNSKFLDEFIDYILAGFAFYQRLKIAGVPAEDASYVLPKATFTKLRVTANLRAWYEYLPKRLCQRAMPEHRELALVIAEELTKAMPEIFDGITANCENCKEKSCSFA